MSARSERTTSLLEQVYDNAPARGFEGVVGGEVGLGGAHHPCSGVAMSDIKITVADRAGRKCASSGSKWEPIMGYSRAVRSGNLIAVTGTVGINADGTYP